MGNKLKNKVVLPLLEILRDNRVWEIIEKFILNLTVKISYIVSHVQVIWHSFQIKSKRKLNFTSNLKPSFFPFKFPLLFYS